jgi:hypothetical protein
MRAYYTDESGRLQQPRENREIRRVGTIVAAAMINAAFTLPLKRMRQWPWENAWLIWTFSALIIFLPLVVVMKLAGRDMNPVWATTAPSSIQTLEEGQFRAMEFEIVE